MMKPLILALFVFTPVAHADGNALVCPDGALKVALCTNSQGASAEFPVAQLLVCQNPSNGYAIQSAVLDTLGDAAITVPQNASAQRINDSQVLYAASNEKTGLVLNGDRQGGMISICPNGQLGSNTSGCISRAAACQ